MIIKPVSEVGADRSLCVHQVRVAAGLSTRSSQHGAYERKRKGVPIDQCGKRSDFLVDGQPICRAHAGQMALAQMLKEQADGAV